MPPPALEPANAATRAPGAWSVFLSSTIDDYQPFRGEVVDVLQRYGAACDDSSRWVGAYDDVETLCRQHLFQANGYLLLLGHWYGSVQTPGGPSITQIEFECAHQRWKDARPRYMAVMQPRPASPADLELQLRADAIVEQRQLDRAEHDRQINRFRQQVTGSWCKVNHFSHVQELREHALVICTTWRSGGFAEAARAANEPDDAAPPRADEAALGRLGRGSQIEALQQALAELKVGPSPALAVLAHGDDAAGQRAFLAHLASQTLQPFRPGRAGMRLPHASLDLDALCAWVALSLGLGTVGDRTPAGIAERAAAMLRERPLCLMLDGVGAYEGGVVAFHQQFWRPFFAGLRALHAALPIPHRLVAVLSDYSGQPQAWAAVARSIDDEPDFDQADQVDLLVALPVLGPYTKAQVRRWLADMNYANEPADHLEQVARRAVTNDRGELDLVPMKVLDRLRYEALRPAEEEP